MRLHVTIIALPGTSVCDAYPACSRVLPTSLHRLSICLSRSVAGLCHNDIAGAAYLTHTAAAPIVQPSLCNVIILIRQGGIGCIEQLLLILRLLRCVNDDLWGLQRNLLHKVQIGVSAQHTGA